MYPLLQGTSDEYRNILTTEVMRKKYKDQMDSWMRFWDMKMLSGMVVDHPMLADMDQYTSQYDAEQMLNKRSAKINNGAHVYLGKLGRKCR